MNAQEQWKTWYRSKRDFHYYNPDQCRYEQRKIRREAALERLVARLQRERDAWKEYAQHQEHCATCGESVSDCETGRELMNKANLILAP